MRAAVARLPAQYVDLVQLRYFEALSYEEVATTLQWPLGMVKVHLHRARTLLAELPQGSREVLSAAAGFTPSGAWPEHGGAAPSMWR